MAEDASVYDLKRGGSPLLVSIPHSGTCIPEHIYKYLTQEAQFLPDTDWFIPELYSFIFAGDITVLQANYSRLVIDLNRPPDNNILYPGKATTELCPLTLFKGGKVYCSKVQLEEEERAQRKKNFWEPYHTALEGEIERIKSRHGFCILYDAHSIRSTMPLLFTGNLPDLNLGTFQGKSCGKSLQDLVEKKLNKNTSLTWVINGRFIGGFITRSYGSPDNHIHAIQMEIAQSAYMDEIDRPLYSVKRASGLSSFLELLIDDLISWSPKH